MNHEANMSYPKERKGLNAIMKTETVHIWLLQYILRNEATMIR